MSPRNSKKKAQPSADAGTPVTITFTPQQADATPCFTFRDLHSATYGPPSQGV